MNTRSQRRKNSRGKAAGAVQPCPFASGNSITALLSPEQRAKVVPCDLASLTMTLIDEGGARTLTGTKPNASGVPLARVDPKVNDLLTSHSLVIVRTIPATTVLKKVGTSQGQLRTAELTKANAEAKADAKFSATMKARCGDHPGHSRNPAIGTENSGGDPKAKELSAETREWSVIEFVKSLWDKPFRDFIGGGRDQVIFAATSCAFPASGDPTGALTALARIELLDEWIAQFVFAKGFTIAFKEEEHRRNGARIYESSLETNDNLAGSSSKLEVSSTSKNGKLIDGKTTRDDKVVDTYHNPAAAKRLEEIRARKDEDKAELSKPVADKFESFADGLSDLSNQDGLSFSLNRNGEELVDSGNWGDALEELQNTIAEILQVIKRLTSLLESGAKGGFPVTAIFGVEMELTLLQAQCDLRLWAEPKPAVQSGTYYISSHRRRWQVNADLVPIKASIEPKIEVQAKFVHKYVGSLTITIEGKIGGQCKIGFGVTDGSGTEDFRFVSRFPMSLSGKGEASAASFYALLEGEATSAITHVWTAGYDGEALKGQQNDISNDALTLHATFKWGNKIWQWFGFGSDEPSKQWPDPGPFVWLEKNELKRKW